MQGNRVLGISIIIGGILILLGTILHPILVDPYAGEEALLKFKHSEMWMFDHILMLIGMFLWLGGLAGSSTYFSKNGAAMFYISLGLWILILTAELTILPLIGNEIIGRHHGVLKKVWEAIFSFGLLGGYFAVACSWAGVALYGWCMKRKENTSFSLWFQNGGLYSGVWGFAGIVFTCCFFRAAYIVLPLTSGPAYLWTMWWGWKLFWKK